MDSRETTIYLAVIITVVVLGLIIGYFAILVIRSQRRTLELQKANALAEISTMEKERSRISTDLHDDLGPVLSVIKFRVDHAARGGKGAERELGTASHQLDTMIARMREIANNLMPSALLRKGLVVAVEEFVNNLPFGTLTKVFITARDQITVPEEKSIHIYRILQEVIHNCLKHAKASELEIIFTQKNNCLELFCRDNGSGFDYEQLLKTSGGIGLHSLKNRTEIMGGKLRVESKPGTGTAFLFEIPVT